MNNSPHQSYDTTPAPGNPTMTEAWALTQAALSLKSAREGEAVDEMCAAVRLNWRLWTIFQADLLAPNCPLPLEIRNNVLSLADFIDKHSINFMTNPVASEIDVLININREIAGGLYDSAKVTQANASDPTQEESSPPASFNSADFEV